MEPETLPKREGALFFYALSPIFKHTGGLKSTLAASGLGLGVFEAFYVIYCNRQFCDFSQ
jgi:hypothetical protein